MRRLKWIVMLTLAVMFLLNSSSFAAGGFSGGGASAGGARGGGSVSSGSSSAGRSSGGGSASSGSRSSGGSSSAPKAGGGGVRPSTPAQPSSGRIAQPAPVARMVPRSLPPNFRAPRGANFVRDTARLRSNPRYMDPYDGAYFGNPASPLYYLYLANLTDNDRGNNPVPYQVQCKPKHTGHSTGIVVLWAFIGLLCGGILVAVFML